MTMNWLITRYKAVQCNYLQKIHLRDGFDFQFSLDESSYYYNEAIHSGIFIFGYCLPRNSSSFKSLSPEQLFVLLSEHKECFYKSIKGIFTIVLIKNGLFSVFNDHLGLSKFFYCGSTDVGIISNSIVQLKELKSNIKLNPNNALEYYIFNYLLNGNTFYNEIFYSKPATVISLDENHCIKKECYFDLEEYLLESKTLFKGAQVIRNAADVLISIIDQYQRYLCNSHVSLTLTAGLDSRIILGSFIRSRFDQFDTFTFGHDKSSDVFYAKQLAKQFNVENNHLYPERSFFEKFAKAAIDVYVKGESLVSIYRAHRMDAYQKVLQRSQAIFMGLGGSDLVRGSGSDGLIISEIAMHCWQKKSFETYLNKENTTKSIKKMGFNSIEYLLDNKEHYLYISNPLLYLFKVIIPLHFGQDILIIKNMGGNVFVPFLDIDYIDFITKTTYFAFGQYNNYAIYDLRRRTKGLYYSAKLSNELNCELSNITLGKGYTPNDIINYLPLIFLKKLVYKKSKIAKSDVANFSYGKWYWNYLLEYFTKNDFKYVDLDKDTILDDLMTVDKKGGELHFMDYSKAVNIHLASKI